MPDNFKWLPDKVVAPLLRALLCIPPRDMRLYLRRADLRAGPPASAAADDV